MFKFLTEFSPLIAFFIGYKVEGIFTATLYTIIGSAIALVITYIVERKINIVTLISSVLLMFSSGLTILSGNPIFIKMKPTILYCIFSLVFFVTLFKGKPAAQYILGKSIYLKEEKNWRRLNIRFMIFFIFMAIINEVIWRSFDENFWVSFKVFGAFPLTLLFIIMQIPYILKHKKELKD